MRRSAVSIVVWLLSLAGVAAAEPPDGSLEGPGGERYVRSGVTGVVSAVAIDRRLRVEWRAEKGIGGTEGAVGAADGTTGSGPRVLLSTDAPGHWAVRDWRSWPMTPTEVGWEARIPLASALTPVVYFLEDTTASRTNQSAMRWFRPKLAGVAEPTFAFSGYLEGFEQGWAGWEWGGNGDGTDWISLSTNAWSGRQALRLEIPGGRGSATVGTVRVRGWMLEEYAPRSLAFLARTESGTGRVRLTLQGDARSENLAVYPAHHDLEVGPAWRRLEVSLKDFVNLRSSRVDWMTLQFLADSGRALLVDDLELVLR